MNPSDHQNDLQPNSTPASRPLNPAQSIHPIQSIQPVRSTLPTVTPEAMAAALAEQPSSSPAPVTPIATPIPPPSAPVTAAPASMIATTEPQAVQSAEQSTVEDQYDDQEYDEDEGISDEAPVTWSAKEFIHHEKDKKWFTIFAAVVVVLLAISIFFMKSVSFAILLVVIAAVVVVYSRRPPRILTYSLTDDGLMVDQTLYEFEKFKSFGVIQDGAEYSVMLIPTQRFQPGVTVYFPEEAGEDIVDMLGSRLPMKDLHLDAVDRLIRLIRL